MAYIYGDATVGESVKSGNGRGRPPLPTLKKEFSKVGWISGNSMIKSTYFKVDEIDQKIRFLCGFLILTACIWVDYA